MFLYRKRCSAPSAGIFSLPLPGSEFYPRTPRPAHSLCGCLLLPVDSVSLLPAPKRRPRCHLPPLPSCARPGWALSTCSREEPRKQASGEITQGPNKSLCDEGLLGSARGCSWSLQTFWRWLYSWLFLPVSELGVAPTDSLTTTVENVHSDVS